ncbi:MAG: hypothetical protein ABSB53_06225 [Nitrososphaerales archaeon]
MRVVSVRLEVVVLFLTIPMVPALLAFCPQKPSPPVFKAALRTSNWCRLCRYRNPADKTLNIWQPTAFL